METLACLQQRTNHRLFHLDKYPPKEEVRDILDAGLDLAPIKCGVAHFRIDIWGPEYKEEKTRLCISSLDDGTPFTDIRPIEEMLEDCIEGGYSYPLQVQLLAPYLLTFHREEDPRKPYSEDYEDSFVNNVAQAGSLAIIISMLANDRGWHSAFNNCWQYIPDYKNEIIGDHPESVMFMLGLGYKREGAYPTRRDRTVNGIKPHKHVLQWK